MGVPLASWKAHFRCFPVTSRLRLLYTFFLYNHSSLQKNLGASNFVTGNQCHLHGIRVLIGVTTIPMKCSSSKVTTGARNRNLIVVEMNIYSLSLSLIIYDKIHISYNIYIYMCMCIYIYIIFIIYNISV